MRQNVTLLVVCSIRILKERQEDHKQPENTPKLNEKDMVKTLITIVDYLQGYLGDNKIPLF